MLYDGYLKHVIWTLHEGETLIFPRSLKKLRVSLTRTQRQLADYFWMPLNNPNKKLQLPFEILKYLLHNIGLNH